MARRSVPRPTHPPPIDLALQGGGSHGAFTWGVLDRLLEDEGIHFDGISGTSAGAMNAAVLATGLAEGGRDGARAALAAFWRDIADTGRCFGQWPQLPELPLIPTPVMALNEAWAAAFKAFWQSFGPYHNNPWDLNLLRDVLERHVRLGPLRAAPVKLFITATSVRTGQPQVFRSATLSHEHLLASACLPHLFKAVPVVVEPGRPAEPFWDGGFSGNPALWPLIYETEALDLLLVRINPLVHADLPDTAAEIQDRLNGITFNQALIGELRAIQFVRDLIDAGSVTADHYKQLRLHMIGDDERLGSLGASSKLTTEHAHLERLFGWGRQAAQDWLARHRDRIGREPSVDIRRDFLEPR